MADHDEIHKSFVRLEMLLDQWRKDIDRRLLPLEGSVRTLSNEVAALRTKHHATEERVAMVHDTAMGAMKKSHDSVAEIRSISAGLIAHIDKTERAHQEASKAHAKRFDAHNDTLLKQGQAIDGIRKSIQHRGQTSTILMIVSMVLIPAITASAIAVIQELKAPVPQTEVKR